MKEQLVGSPIPYMGGKRKKKVTAITWGALGADVPTYVEPFFGGGSMLLARPGGAGKYEVVGDANGLLINAWRAIQQEPQAVAGLLQQPLSELELACKARVLRGARDWIELMREVPGWCDVTLAAWWIWCQCASFSPDWLTQPNPPISKPYRRGILSIESDPEAWLQALAERLSKVSMAHGDWARLVTPSALGLNNTGTFPTAVFLDPPYPDEKITYDSREGLAQEVVNWCAQNGDDERLRIVLCGHSGDYELSGWTEVNWGGSGGWGRTRRGENESIWLSPHCLSLEGDAQLSLLGGAS